MTFPSNPTNLQSTVNNGITWVYYSNIGAWEKLSAGSTQAPLSLTSVSSLTVNGNITTTGNYVTNDGTIFNTAYSLGTRNRLINGSFDIWQRGSSFSNMGSTTSYTADRWSCFRVAYTTNITVSQVTGLSQNGNNRNALRLQRTAGDTNTQALSATQSLESINSRDLAGQTVTLSGWIRNGVNFSGTSVGFAIYSGTGTDESARAGYTGGYTVSQSQLTTTTSFQRFSITGVVPSNANELNVQIYYTPSGTAGTNDFIDIMDVQFEIGSVATPFERRLIGQELALCQRYFNIVGASDNTRWSGQCTSGSTYYATYTFPPMRTSPSVSGVDSGSGTAGFNATTGTLTVRSNVSVTEARTATGTTTGGYYGSTLTLNAEI